MNGETEPGEAYECEGHSTDIETTHEQGLSVRAISERLKISKTTVSTYLLRTREAGLTGRPLPPGLNGNAVLQRRLFIVAAGRPRTCRSPTGARSPVS